METEFYPKTRAIFYQTTLHHIWGCNLNLRPIQDTRHQHRTCPRDNMSINYNIFTYFDTESYAGEAEGSADYGTQRGHDEDGNALHATHGGDVAYKNLRVCILRKQHTAH